MTPQMMARTGRLGAVLVVAGLLGALAPVAAQAPRLVETVRDSLSRQDFAGGERQLADYRARQGVTPEYLEALSWMGRVARTAKQYERADKYARDTHELVLQALKTGKLENEPSLQTALGAAIEVEGHVLAETGARSEAVAFLQREANTIAARRSVSASTRT